MGLLTREFPPEVYGGAGVHVEYLSRELAQLPGLDLAVYCFGSPRPSGLVRAAFGSWPALPEEGAGAALQAVAADLRMAAALTDADVVHSHTWYANLGGHLAKLLYGVPHVMTAHSLEPLRPWKADQLGGGYAVSSFCERAAIESADAIVAVSGAMAADVRACYPQVDPSRVRVIHNGIDPDEYRRDERTDVLARFGIEPDRPVVMWVGRITGQKGIGHLLDMAELVSSDAQLVFCAGAPDTPAIGSEMRNRAAVLAERRRGVHWIEEMLPRSDVVQLLSHATVFVCPSIYEPFGLINLEAMACGVPVVATAVGGIPEIVVDGETGWLVPVGPVSGAGSPLAGSVPAAAGLEVEPAALGAALAERVNRVLGDPSEAVAMGQAGRRRVLDFFTWRAVAEQTASLYRQLVDRH
ncbi:MAG: glycogen synthase [Acidimicrobiales bacterium]